MVVPDWRKDYCSDPRRAAARASAAAARGAKTGITLNAAAVLERHLLKIWTNDKSRLSCGLNIIAGQARRNFLQDHTGWCHLYIGHFCDHRVHHLDAGERQAAL